VLVFPLASVATQFTKVVPIGKFDPDGGKQSTPATSQLSDVAGASNETTA
jgi:hypothetical protein